MARTASTAGGRLPRGELAPRELLSYRLLLGVGGSVVVALGFMYPLVDPEIVDPWSERLAVASLVAAALLLSFVYRRPGFRYVMYVAGYGTTIFRQRSQLLWYCITTVGLVGTASALTTDVQIPLLTYLTYVVTLSVLCVLMLGTRLAAEEELALSEERYALAAEAANDGLWDWDLETGRIYYAPRWKATLGYAAHEIEDDPEEWLCRVHPSDLPRLRVEIEDRHASAPPQFEIELRVRHRDGGYRWMLVRGLRVYDAQTERLVRIAGSQSDVTDRKAAEERILHDAFHDVLTGLPNRALFEDRLERLIKRTRHRSLFYFAVFCADLDRFKVVNESLGHAVGNELLQQVGSRLLSCLRVEDTVARLGGDEFALLLPDVGGAEGAIRVADRVQEELAKPFVVGGEEVFVSASMGIALSSSDYRSPEEAVRDAEIAMYRAKSDAGGGYAIFDTEMHARSMGLLRLEREMRRGIDRGEFQPWYQPLIHLETDTVVGFEALARWDHPERGLLLPGEFIRLAEETGLVVPLGREILRQACLEARTWRAAGPGGSPLTLSVNLSAHQLARPDVLETIEEVLDEAELEPGMLSLEVTESTVMRDPTQAARVLSSLRERGVRISLDDFGTGHSSLENLHRLPVDTIKIDRSFVETMRTDAGGTGAKLVESIVFLARSLGMGSIAEGVETREQSVALRRMGCVFGQGFFYAKPLDERSAQAFLARGSAPRERTSRGAPAADAGGTPGTARFDPDRE